MYDYDYKILIDRDGQPYICHAGMFDSGGNAVSGRQKGAQTRNHKYIARIQERRGYRYFYTPEELKAYYNQGITAVKNATGITARNNLQRAQERANNANFLNRRKRNSELNAAREAYDSTPLGRAEQTTARAKKYGEKVVSSISNSIENLRRKVDERENRKKADNLGSDTARSEKFAKKKTQSRSAKPKNEDTIERHGRELPVGGMPKEGWSKRRSMESEESKKEDAMAESRQLKNAQAHTQTENEAKSEEAMKEDARAESRQLKNAQAHEQPKSEESEKEDARAESRQLKNDQAHENAQAHEQPKSEESEKEDARAESRQLKNDQAHENAQAESAEESKTKTVAGISGEFSKNGSASKNSEKASPKNSEKTSKPDEAAIQEIRKIAANSDRSLSIEERQNLGKKYGLDEKTLNIIDGNLRHPDMQGPTGQKWIDDYIRKHAKIPEAETEAADEGNTNKDGGTKQDSKPASGSDEKAKAEEKTGSDDTSDRSSDLSTEGARTEQIASRNTGSASSSGSRPKIDASKVSAQYLMNLASNSGIDTKKLETADDAYFNAQREYNRLLNSSSSSGQERASAQRAMQKAQQVYEGELQKLVDQLNK